MTTSTVWIYEVNWQNDRPRKFTKDTLFTIQKFTIGNFDHLGHFKVHSKEILHYRETNGLQLVKDLNEDRTKYLPCGQFNKDNSCDLPFVHLNEKNENLIHGCALCYHALYGLINIHLLRKCPLLPFIT